MDDFDCDTLISLVLFLFPFFGHSLQSWLCLFLTYCFARKSSHPTYASVAVCGFLSWVPFLAIRYHERRAINRRAQQAAMEMTRRQRDRDNMIQTSPPPPAIDMDNEEGFESFSNDAAVVVPAPVLRNPAAAIPAPFREVDLRNLP